MLVMLGWCQLDASDGGVMLGWCQLDASDGGVMLGWCQLDAWMMLVQRAHVGKPRTPFSRPQPVPTRPPPPPAPLGPGLLRHDHLPRLLHQSAAGVDWDGYRAHHLQLSLRRVCHQRRPTVAPRPRGVHRRESLCLRAPRGVRAVGLARARSPIDLRDAATSPFLSPTLSPTNRTMCNQHVTSM